MGGAAGFREVGVCPSPWCFCGCARGRLSSITRDSEAVDFCYDRFGRQTRDGELTYAYDVNGNPAQIGYPGSVSAAYAYDFADRPLSLSVTTPSGTVPVASGATYLPSGPLQSLTLGNGTSEARTFTPRYFPESITWEGSPARAWDYTTDAMGNVTAIERTIACAGDVVIANQTLSTTQTLESCAGLEVGPNVTLTDTADVTFRAAGGVSFDTGFAVQTGARMSVEPGATVDPPELRLFDYQDGPYFLTRGDGPWGERDWDYDRIGNRLSETRERSTSPAVDTYAYLANGSGGDTAILNQIQLSPSGTADYAWDAAGNLDTLTRGANHLDFTSDDASRLAGIDRGDGMTVFNSAVFHYDGRSFLRRAEDPASGASVEPLYSSSGLLQALLEHDSPTGPDHRHTVFYFAGRPVAQLTQDAGGESWQYPTTDHLGTPLVAADDAGVLTWTGGFEPFGQDSAADTSASALDAGVFLRFPGQWETELWKDASLGTGGLYYNMHRWYQSAAGRYTRPDPLRWGTLGISDLPPIEVQRGAAKWTGDPARQIVYAYVADRPSFYVDPDGRFIIYIRPFDRTCGEQQARRALREAANAANQPGFPGGPGGIVDGPADAYRHCLWSCLMQTNCGWTTAFIGGWGHELQDWTYASGMDTFNNAQGRDCASSGSCPCDQCCRQRLMSGSLQSTPTGGQSDAGQSYGF